MLVNKPKITTMITTVTVIIYENSQGTVISSPVVLEGQPQASSISVTGELVRNADSLAHCIPNESKTLEMRNPRIWVLIHLKFEHRLKKGLLDFMHGI